MTVQISGNTVNCPVCGNPQAQISDGVYRATKDAIEVLSGPDSTRAMVEAFKALAERLKSGEISQPEAVKEAETISPRYAALLDTFIRIGLPSLAVLVAIIGLYLQYHGGKSSSDDAKKMLDAITRQTFVMEGIANKQRVEQKGHIPASKKAKPREQAKRVEKVKPSEQAKQKAPALKPPSERRAGQ